MNKESIAESHKKYREKNKEMLVDKHKVYADNNKDKIAGYNKKYYDDNKDILGAKIECECGCVISRSRKARHFKTKIHRAFEKGANKRVEP